MTETKIPSTALFPVETDYISLHVSQSVNWTWVEEFQIGYALEGNITLMYADQIRTLKPGDGFFINTGVRYSFANEGKETALFYLLRFHPRLIGGSQDSILYQRYVNPVMHNRSFTGSVFRHDSDGDKEILEHFAQSFVFMHYRVLGYELFLRNELSFVILDLYGRQNFFRDTMSVKERRNEDRIRTMMAFVEENYSEPLTVEDIANSTSISVSECIRCFKSTLRTTPIKYVLELRLMHAADLLAQTSRNINDIAYACGFQEMSYFTRCFKKQYELTPSAFRKSMQEA